MYMAGGSAALCSRCASRRMEPLADDRCMICDQGYAAGEPADCKNPLCNAGWREFDWNASIALRTGTLMSTINLYKASGHRALAAVFGHILVGYLDADPSLFSTWDLIVAAQTFMGPGPGTRAFDHTREVLAAAAKEAPGPLAVRPGRAAGGDPHRGTA